MGGIEKLDAAVADSGNHPVCQESRILLGPLDGCIEVPGKGLRGRPEILRAQVEALDPRRPDAVRRRPMRMTG
ncbi:MAG: hypothetical protein A2Z31_08160 [candidate division NC10 bacterium RBG_16_65_8]|nr:MAG: hypothetical protein A2Z31_08160 [candidate division NC10 bacterium RBG_16_65_8]